MDEIGKDKTLWARLKAAETPDALTLAAYAEGRLRGDAAARVEAFLGARPDAAADVAAARAGAPEAASDAVERVAARAMALVAGPAPGVVPLRGRFVRWTEAAAVAASVALVAYAGFELGAAQSAPAESAVDILDGAGFLPPLDGAQA